MPVTVLSDRNNYEFLHSDIKKSGRHAAGAAHENRPSTAYSKIQCNVQLSP
jgi:hypothetical protein